MIRQADYLPTIFHLVGGEGILRLWSSPGGLIRSKDNVGIFSSYDPPLCGDDSLAAIALHSYYSADPMDVLQSGRCCLSNRAIAIGRRYNKD
jgi:hypothetical protein